MTDNTILIAGQTIAMGQSRQLNIPVARLYTDTELFIPVHVQRANKAGPTVFVSAAIHGDELNGVEIIRRLIASQLPIIKGTLILVPMVNVYGVLNQSRYLPDRRDLNRCFPGSLKGSLTSRLAYTFMTNIVQHCDYGIDLHTGAIHRSNLPQIRANLADEETLSLAKAFGVPVLMNATLRDGSLREAATSNNTRILLYEAGEALRFDPLSIQAGVKGVKNVLMSLGLLRKSRRKKPPIEPFVSNKSEWIRAAGSGFVNEAVKLGERVEKGQILADINSPLGAPIQQLTSTRSGIIIGKQNIPLVQEGDAMFHIAYFGKDEDDVAEHIELLHDLVEND
ncbi:succinylglutamate desuccinylase/aspartoacylase family protein [Vibrio europaeus]|uniref:succinylglutamate desuccinylase/aspartoacylase family protein n=1 Tax=Vibrio oreintalis group TaxID=1891919 RepID=UPI0018A7C099|nr:MULTISPECIES: succinylglutamate desuccinylase/aspartoacylase family protein [Vibrio oreintalis group]MCG9579380.1 succinylglutamate desuccinylase/aspartoacylase family protein [Vibrio tubiashii]MDC5808195.1 succinylglutamate desuccinylase/aspartoacylase family protein [Vibrio europaeus]QPG38216.1 succinylglutamate desuccinylase/aspartoacylase family protein [Vibrio europaeus]